MPVPNTFANATTSIPLSQLDANFATAITLGNTSIQLGNTVTTLNNMTFANVTVSSGSVTVANVTVTGVGTFAAGSNTAPSITTSGDTNTGFFFPAADTVATTTGGTERMRVDSSGNVGIGTSSPSTGIANRILAINGTDTGISFLVSGTDTSRIFCSAGELRLQTSTAIPLVCYTNNSERMRIDSSGRVSIGSTTVNALLTVDGVGPTINNQAFAYFAESGGAAISGYATGQNVTNSIWASGRVSALEFDARSDARLKKDITPIPASDALHFVQNVMPVHYKWISGPDDGHKFGFLAQDVVKAGFPNLVGQYPDSNVQEVTDTDGFTSPAGVMLTVNYDQIVPVLASALRDALAQIDALKARLTALEAK